MHEPLHTGSGAPVVAWRGLAFPAHGSGVLGRVFPVPQVRARSVRVVLVVLAASCGVLVGCGDDGIQGLTLFADPGEGDAPLEVEFAARTESTEEGLSYEWDFGDGSESTEQSPTHTYFEPGDYDVSVTVTNESDRSARAVETVRVTGTAAESEGAPADFAGWVALVNDICAASTEDAAAVPGDPNSPEALAEFVRINNAETEAVAAVGLPEDGTARAEGWVALRNEGSELFVSLATEVPTSADDPRIAELDAVALELDALSGELGLDSCRGQ